MAHEPLGYDYNDGGINNQKLALIGLFVAAYKKPSDRPKRVFLPNIFNKYQGDAFNLDQSQHRSTEDPIGSVFVLEHIVDFARRWDIEIVDRPSSFEGDRLERNGWNLFGVGAQHIGYMAEHYRNAACLDIAADLIRSLVPKISSDHRASLLFNEVFFNRSIKTVVQFRIEEDWYLHCHHTLKPTLTSPEDYDAGAELISKKLVYSRDTGQFPDRSSTVYVTVDERYLRISKEKLREQVRDTTGIEIVLKSDILTGEVVDEMRPVDASLLDFSLAKRATNFVGTSRSTFANLVCLERTVEKFQKQTSDYIYNKVGPGLSLRTDAGTLDDPGAVSPDA